MLAFGLPGLVYLVLVVVSHMLVDRWKVQATRRAEGRAQAAALARMERTGEVPTSGLGGAWTPWPGMLFLADQALHMTFAIVGWLVILYGVPLTAVWVDVVNLVLRDWNRATRQRGDPDRRRPGVAVPRQHPRRVLLRARARLAARPATDRRAAHRGRAGRRRRACAGVAARHAGRARRRAGADRGDDRGAGAAPDRRHRARRARRSPSGFVIAAKTIARFKQLDDRGFAEYYLLGTLASVSVAFFTAIIAKAALGTIP